MHKCFYDPVNAAGSDVTPRVFSCPACRLPVIKGVRHPDYHLAFAEAERELQGDSKKVKISER